MGHNGYMKSEATHTNQGGHTMSVHTSTQLADGTTLTVVAVTHADDNPSGARGTFYRIERRNQLGTFVRVETTCNLLADAHRWVDAAAKRAAETVAASHKGQMYADLRKKRPDWTALDAARTAAYYPRLTPREGADRDETAEVMAESLVHTLGANPVVRIVKLREELSGWVVREYANGKYDATDDKALSPGFDSYDEAVKFVTASEMGAEDAEPAQVGYRVERIEAGVSTTPLGIPIRVYHAAQAVHAFAAFLERSGVISGRKPLTEAIRVDDDGTMTFYGYYTWKAYQVGVRYVCTGSCVQLGGARGPIEHSMTCPLYSAQAAS